jgi:predicted DNA-binding protein
MPKVSTQLLVDPIVKERVEALALVRGQLQADVLRRLVEAALPEMEAESKSELAELYELLDGMKVGRERAMDAMLKAKLPIAALRGRKRFPLPLG